MLERAGALKARAKAGDVLMGSWVAVPSPMVAEIVADTGFDYVVIDTEHGPTGYETLANMLMAFRGVETVPLVRVQSNDPVPIKRTLDAGAEGIMVPNVRSVEEAKAAVAACRYPPDGERGFGPLRASGYYAHADAYVPAANANVIVAIQIEDKRAVEDIDNILDVPGIDIVVVGPNDMSGTYGLFRQHDHPTMVEARKTVIAAARQRGLPVCPGIPVSPDVLKAQVAEGYTVLFAAADAGALVEGLAVALANGRAATS